MLYELLIAGFLGVLFVMYTIIALEKEGEGE